MIFLDRIFLNSLDFKPYRLFIYYHKKGTINFVLRVSSFSEKVDPGEEFTVPKLFNPNFTHFPSLRKLVMVSSNFENIQFLVNSSKEHFKDLDK